MFYSEGCHSMLRAVSIAAGILGASLKLTVWLRTGQERTASPGRLISE